jgi:hypothetical protein
MDIYVRELLSPVLVLCTFATFSLFWVNSKFNILLLVYWSHKYQKTKITICADTNHNKILQTVLNKLLAHFLKKKTSSSLYWVRYILTKPSPYTKQRTCKTEIHTAKWCFRLLCKWYSLQGIALLVTRKMLQITKHKISCLQLPDFITWWQHSYHVNSITTRNINPTHFIKPLKMDLTEGSETSTNINQTPVKYPKFDTLNTEHSESLKSRKILPSLHPTLCMYLNTGYLLKATRIQVASMSCRLQ